MHIPGDPLTRPKLNPDLNPIKGKGVTSVVDDTLGVIVPTRGAQLAGKKITFLEIVLQIERKGASGE